MDGTLTRKGIGRIAALLLALCVAALAGSIMFATQAQADTVSQFSIQSGEEGDVSAYRLFSADVEDETNGASNVAWNADYRSDVLAFLDRPAATTGASQAYGQWLFDQELVTRDLTGVSAAAMTAAERAAHDSAANALAYIAAEISSSSGATRNGLLITADGTFSNNLAVVLKAKTATDTKTVADGWAVFYNIDEGFYLFSHEASAPVWTPVGGNTITAALKTDAILSVEKKVLDADSGEYGKLTDAGLGQSVTFQVIGSLPNSAPSGYQYHYTLEDTLPTGLAYVGDSLTAKAVTAAGDETDVANLFQVEFDAATSKLTAASNDLYAVSNATALNGAVKIVFNYKATVTSDATMGTSFNTNSAKLIYGKDGELLETTPDSANVATYEIDIVKKSSEDNSPLEGAKFTIKKGEQYIQEDGTLGADPYEFTTNGSGKIEAPRIDDGTYTLNETRAPLGYSTPASTETEVVITATKNVEEGTLDDLTATASNGATVEADVNSGKVTVTILNDPATVLPITGMTPNQLGTVVGIILVVAGAVALLVRSRKQKKANVA